MQFMTRRLRSFLIALAVLALSATVALAGRTAVSAPTHPTTDQQQAGPSEAPEVEESESPESEAPESEAPESPDPSDGDASDAAAGEHPDNHGKLVSEAAQGETPAGFDNHGAYVRTIAHDNHGHGANKSANR